MLLGYVRVSTNTQNPNLQIDALLKVGGSEKNIYADISSGAKAERKGLDEMLSKLREGDTLVVWKMDRIARSLSHLVKLIKDFEKKKIHFKSIQENFIDTSSPHGRFVFNLFASIAQLESDILIERTRARLESSRRRGALGPRPGLSKQAQHKGILAEKYYRDSKLSIEEIMKLLEIGSKLTLYKYLAHQGRRICKECGILFWDKTQNLNEAHCKEHIK